MELFKYGVSSGALISQARLAVPLSAGRELHRETCSTFALESASIQHDEICPTKSIKLLIPNIQTSHDLISGGDRFILENVPRKPLLVPQRGEAGEVEAWSLSPLRDPRDGAQPWLSSSSSQTQRQRPRHAMSLPAMAPTMPTGGSPAPLCRGGPPPGVPQPATHRGDTQGTSAKALRELWASLLQGMTSLLWIMTWKGPNPYSLWVSSAAPGRERPPPRTPRDAPSPRQRCSRPPDSTAHDVTPPRDATPRRSTTRMRALNSSLSSFPTQLHWHAVVSPPLLPAVIGRLRCQSVFGAGRRWAVCPIGWRRAGAAGSR